MTSLRGQLAMGVYVGSLMLVAMCNALALLFFRSPLSTIFLIAQAVLLLLPLGKTPTWGHRLNKFALRSYSEWTDFKVIYEAGEENTFVAEREPYVIGYEPHSVLPFGLPQVFSDAAPFRANLSSMNTLATSVVGYCPLIRHLFHWLNGVPASRKVMHDILSRGGSVAVIPGGVAECAYMEPGEDVVFLKSRRGFVKAALINGAPLVPVYCFGQNEAFRFLRIWPPFLPLWLYDRAVRTLLFCPMIIYGHWGTPIPRKVSQVMVIGKPLSIPRISNPSHEEIQHHLDAFIEAMRGLYQRHQAAAGYPDSKLVVM